MSHTRNPSCLGLFDSLAPECASCAAFEPCLQIQEKNLQGLAVSQESNSTVREESKKEIKPKTKTSTPSEKPEKDFAHNPNAQIIPKHLRKPLDIPPVGTHLLTQYRGNYYQAVVVADASNPRTGGRSILFDGTVYRTLTAAAHAIAPGINSGAVWQIA